MCLLFTRTQERVTTGDPRLYCCVATSFERQSTLFVYSVHNPNAASEFICLKVKSRNKLLPRHLKITATTPSDSELCILCSVVFRAPKNLIQSITIFNLKAASEFSCLKVKSRKKFATIFN